MNYTQEDVIREKAELATCLHPDEHVDFKGFTGLDGGEVCGTQHGVCGLCEAEVERDGYGWGHDYEVIGDGSWRLAQ